MFSFILLDDISLSITFGACSQIMTMVTTIPPKATVSGCDGDSLRMHTHLGFLVFSYYIVGKMVCSSTLFAGFLFGKTLRISSKVTKVSYM